MKSCLCVIGWHFPPAFYETLQKILDIDVYVISHRTQKQVPEKILKLVTPERFIFTNNIGYDWGGYQQFLNLKIFQEYDYCFFCHDDIHIKNSDLFKFCVDRLAGTGKDSHILGNGRQTQKRDWPRTHIQSYAHSYWKPPSWDFLHDTVRGSFWATSKEVLQKIYPLEVFWDRRKILGVGSGNWSLRATCGKAQEILGEQAFSYISESYMTSELLDEYSRGNPVQQKKPLSIGWKIRNRVVVTYARSIMTFYMNARSIKVKKWLASTMIFTFKYF